MELTRRTDEEILWGQHWADEWNLKVYRHIRGFKEFAGRLGALPVVRGREEFIYLEVACQARPETG